METFVSRRTLLFPLSRQRRTVRHDRRLILSDPRGRCLQQLHGHHPVVWTCDIEFISLKSQAPAKVSRVLRTKAKASMTTPSSQLLQYDFCVPEAQRLADLTGIKVDLEAAVAYCDLHIDIDPTAPGLTAQEMLQREHTRQALCRAFLVMYGRSWGWGSGVRTGLGDQYIQKLSPAALKLHTIVKDHRDKWVAHAVNQFDDIGVRIDVERRCDETLVVRGVSTTGHLVGGFVRDWMIKFRTLASNVIELVKQELSSESNRLSEFVRQMPIESVISRERVDQIQINHYRAELDLKKTRKLFR
jgi:hypothetical protein